VLIRGDALLGRAEAACYGAFIATILGGSVVLYLGATPFVYSEDFAWSIPLTIGALFALLGVLERPSRGGVIASGVFVLCCVLNRTPPGWGCCIAALLLAGWFALGRAGASNRRWALPIAAVGVIPFLISSAVTYAKFGIPIGLPMADQVWAHVNPHRRYFLAANGGKAFSFAFLPSTLSAYLQPIGVRVSGIFPFVTPPGAPAPWLAGAVMDQSYPTASFTDTSPLLLLLGVWGVITAFRPKGVGRVHLTRIILLGAAAGAAGVLLWGYISQRYLADLMPLFIIAGAIGLIDVWRRLETKTPRIRGAVLGLVTVGGVYCIAANLAVAAFPVSQWTSAQSARFIAAEQSWSLTPMAGSVHHGSTVPLWGPAGQIFAMNNCSGLYLSSGNDLKDVPGQQIEHYTWMPVEQPSSFTRVIGFTFNRPLSAFSEPVTVMTYGTSRLVLERVPQVPGDVQFHLYDSGTTTTWPSPISWKVPITQSEIHHELEILVTVDPNLHRFVVNWYNNQVLINHYVAGAGHAVVLQTPGANGSAPSIVRVRDVPLRESTIYPSSDQAGRSKLTLCRSLTQAR
jgi:hypothetical protein